MIFTIGEKVKVRQKFDGGRMTGEIEGIVQEVSHLTGTATVCTVDGKNVIVSLADLCPAEKRNDMMFGVLDEPDDISHLTDKELLAVFRRLGNREEFMKDVTRLSDRIYKEVMRRMGNSDNGYQE